MDYYIGIDNSSLDHKVRIIDETGKQKFSSTIRNSYEGFEELDRTLRNYSNSKIGFELPHGPLIDYLHMKGYHLFSLNPLKIKRYKESIKVSGNKNDDIDARAIAEYMRNNVNNLRELAYNSPAIERLKTLSIIHSRLTNEHARYLNKLHFTVRQYFPLHDALFSHFGCTAQLALIRKYPAYDCLRSVPDDDIKGLLKTHHYRRTKHLDKLIAKIRNYCQMISPDVEFAYRFEAECLCKIILVISEELNRIKREMNMIIDSHPLGNTFKSLPGAGNILACKLLALFGDNKDRFGNSNGAQCLFGTAPKNYQSGMYHKIIMRKACNKSGRDLLYKFAFSTLQFSKWAREYYDKQRLKGKTHSVSVRALSNKWVKVIYKVWKDEMLYDDNIKISSAA